MTLRLSYRRYEQTKANFFDPDRTRPSSIMSADPKLRDFDTELYGLKLVYRMKDVPISQVDRLDLELAYSRWEEPRHFHADLMQLTIRMIY